MLDRALCCRMRLRERPTVSADDLRSLKRLLESVEAR